MDIETEQEHAPRSCSGRPSPACCGSARSTTSWWRWPSSGSPAPASRCSARSTSSASGTRARPRPQRHHSIIGLAVVPRAARRLLRRRPALPARPQKPSLVAGVCIAVYGGLYSVSLYMPHLWMVVLLQFLAQRRRWRPCPSASSRPWPPPPRPRCGPSASRCSASTPRVRRVRRRDPARGHQRRHQRHDRAHLHRAGLRHGGVLLLVGSRFVRRDITLVIEDVLERYAEGKRRKAGGAIPALQIHNLDFFYGTSRCSST